MASSGNAELDGFIARYTPELAAQTHAALARMRARLPGATILVYDNYNALAIGFAPGERAGQAILSIAAYPRWLTLFFLHGAGLDDPAHLLQGSGSRVRSIRLAGPETLDDPQVEALIAAALASAAVPLTPNAKGSIVIKAISAKQRPRRPH
jgi:hypothetical protein